MFYSSNDHFEEKNAIFQNPLTITWSFMFSEWTAGWHFGVEMKRIRHDSTQWQIWKENELENEIEWMIPGRSEKSRIASLNVAVMRLGRSWRIIASPEALKSF